MKKVLFLSLLGLTLLGCQAGPPADNSQVKPPPAPAKPETPGK